MCRMEGKRNENLTAYFIVEIELVLCYALIKIAAREVLEGCELGGRERMTQILIRYQIQHVLFSRGFSKEIHLLSLFTSFE